MSASFLKCDQYFVRYTLLQVLLYNSCLIVFQYHNIYAASATVMRVRKNSNSLVIIDL